MLMKCCIVVHVHALCPNACMTHTLTSFKMLTMNFSFYTLPTNSAAKI